MAQKLRFCTAFTGALTISTLMASTLMANAASGQEDKTEIQVTSFLNDVATLKYEYVFRQYSWALMSYDLDAQDDVTYRRPANLPGCKQLIDWGIDKGRFTITSNDKEVCSGPLSICDMRNFSIEVHPGGCKWRALR
ncbi:MAG: hypothetical protein JNM81_12155 [Rhodospirillaceae bacterium]|nr:hypothetical protein [Rhodospirillaceae bacterium]